MGQVARRILADALLSRAGGQVARQPIPDVSAEDVGLGPLDDRMGYRRPEIELPPAPVTTRSAPWPEEGSSRKLPAARLTVARETLKAAERRGFERASLQLAGKRKSNSPGS